MVKPIKVISINISHSANVTLVCGQSHFKAHKTEVDRTSGVLPGPFTLNTSCKEDMDTKDNKVEVKKPEDEEINDFYDWELVPTVYPDESKTGVTFKGDSKEYVKAQGMVLELFNKKGAKYFINDDKV